MSKNDLNKKANIFKNFIWSVLQLYSFDYKYVIFLMVNSTFKGVIPVISMLIMQKLINIVQIGKLSFNNVLQLLIAITLIELFQEICFNFFNLKIHSFEMEYRLYLQTSILAKSSLLEAKTFENSDTYDLINRMQYDSESGILGYIKIVFQIISSSITLISYITIIFSYNCKILLIISIFPIVKYFFSKRFNILEYDLIKKNTEKERKAFYFSWIITNGDAFKEIKLYNLFNFFIGEYSRNLKMKNDEELSLEKKKTIVYSIIGFIEIIVDFFVLLVLLKEAYIRNILVGDFVLYSGAITNIKQNMLSMFQSIAALHKNSLIIEQLKSYFELENEPLMENGVIIDTIKQLELVNVSYRYKKNCEYALRDINLTIHENEKIALLGLNGSGKTTLVKIIMGIYHDYEGEIYVNGINLKQINIKSYRKKIGALFQDFIKYESSIRDNISFGNLKERNNDSKILSLLDQLQLESLKKNIDVELGYQFNNGRQISIGQWQKIGLGRAIIRDADVYILDEPNSSLDKISEKHLLDLLSKSFENKICIIVVHRFKELVEKADKIIVLNEGTISEVGTHKELFYKKGIYYKLYSLQNNGNNI